MISSRYPYTYAFDYLRRGMDMSRSDASDVMRKICFVTGMDRMQLAKDLADAYLLGEYNHE